MEPAGEKRVKGKGEHVRRIAQQLREGPRVVFGGAGPFTDVSLAGRERECQNRGWKSRG